MCNREELGVLPDPEWLADDIFERIANDKNMRLPRAAKVGDPIDVDNISERAATAAEEAEPFVGLAVTVRDTKDGGNKKSPADAVKAVKAGGARIMPDGLKESLKGASARAARLAAEEQDELDDLASIRQAIEAQNDGPVVHASQLVGQLGGHLLLRSHVLTDSFFSTL
jgi:hypothetical protein